MSFLTATYLHFLIATFLHFITAADINHTGKLTVDFERLERNIENVIGSLDELSKELIDYPDVQKELSNLRRIIKSNDKKKISQKMIEIIGLIGSIASISTHPAFESLLRFLIF